jgi:tellurite methyltransferase
MVNWDERYRSGSYGGNGDAHMLLARFHRAIPKGRVLDVAMGTGRDALFLAERGYEVYGLEQSMEAITLARQKGRAAGARFVPVHGDAAAPPFKEASMEGIIVFYFLLREPTAALLGILKKKGVIIYETFLKRQNEVDRYRNPDYLLGDGELVELFRPLDLLHYEEGVFRRGGRQRAVAQYVGRKR